MPSRDTSRHYDKPWRPRGAPSLRRMRRVFFMVEDRAMTDRTLLYLVPRRNTDSHPGNP